MMLAKRRLKAVRFALKMRCQAMRQQLSAHGVMSMIKVYIVCCEG